MNISAKESSESRPSMFHDIGQVVQVNPLNLDHYVHDEFYATVGQTLNPNDVLCDINDANFHALAYSFHNYNFEYVHCMMTVYFSSTDNPEGVT